MGIARISSYVALVALVGAGLTGVVSASASPGSCKITNQDSGISYTDFTVAVNDAGSGDTLKVKGLCIDASVGGYLTLVDKPLTVYGKPGRGANQETPTIPGRINVVEGGDLTLEGTLRVEYPSSRAISNAGRVTVQDDVVIAGRPFNGTSLGGAIFNEGDLRMRGNALVTGGEALVGGGIYNEGRLEMMGNSAVLGSVATLSGGGIANESGGEAILGEDARVAGNSASRGAGISNLDSKVEMTGRSVISGNQADRAAFFDSYGGGIANEGVGGVALFDDASIRGNTAKTYGGGMANLGSATVDMGGAATITRNKADGIRNYGPMPPDRVFGGGIWTECADLLTGAVAGSNVSMNNPDDIRVSAAPVCP